MSMTNPGAVVLILNETVAPELTLMSVAKPCSVASPAPWMSQSPCGLPANWFSQTTGLVAHAGACASVVVHRLESVGEPATIHRPHAPATTASRLANPPTTRHPLAPPRAHLRHAGGVHRECSA